MNDQPPRSALPSIAGALDAHREMLAHLMAAELRRVTDNSTRHSLARVREVAIAMANVQGSPGVFEARGESLLAHLNDPNTGHLVATMALYMSLQPANAVGALKILEHAAAYILRTARAAG